MNVPIVEADIPEDVADASSVKYVVPIEEEDSDD